jgi:L-threonylcarbamoyladenylate synthase
MCVSDLANVIDALRAGAVIVYPTDTLYALGADIFNDVAVHRVFRLKQRPGGVPLPVAVADYAGMQRLAVCDERVKTLVDCFLPGRLTVVLRKKVSGLDTVTGGLDTIAVRIPCNEVALELLARFGPLTVTSANVHGCEPAYVIKDLRMQFKDEDIAYYLDHGRLDGRPSTIVDMTTPQPKVLREGAISEQEILNAV